MERKERVQQRDRRGAAAYKRATGSPQARPSPTAYRDASILAAEGGGQYRSDPLFPQAAKATDHGIVPCAFEPGKHLQSVESPIELFHDDCRGKMDDPARIAFRGADPPAQIIVEAAARLRIVELLRMGASDALAVCFIPQNQNPGLRVVHETPVRYLQNVYDFPLGIDDHQRFSDLSFRASCHNTVFFVFSVKLSFFPSGPINRRKVRFFFSPGFCIEFFEQGFPEKYASKAMRRKIFHKEIADPPCANTADAINFAGKRVGFSAVALRRRVLSIKGGMEGGIEEEE